MKKIVNLCGLEHPVNEENIEKFRAAGAEVIQRRDCWNEQETIEEASDADGILFSNAPLNAGVLKQLKKCKFAVRHGIGMDNIDSKAATELGMVVANVREAFTEEVSNHAFSMLLALARRIKPLDRIVHEGDWNDPETKKYWGGTKLDPAPVREQTLGLIGYGRIGQSSARKAKAFKMKVLAFDPYVDAADLEKDSVEQVDLETLLKQSDYLILNCPLTDETRGLIGEKQLGMMKSSACLINVARGGIVDEHALAKALKNGTIAGAGVDVFSKEPIAPDNPLRGIDNAILTPHAGFFSRFSLRDIRNTVANQAISVLKGEWPSNLYNMEVKEKIDISNLWSD